MYNSSLDIVDITMSERTLTVQVHICMTTKTYIYSHAQTQLFLCAHAIYDLGIGRGPKLRMALCYDREREGGRRHSSNSNVQRFSECEVQIGWSVVKKIAGTLVEKGSHR